MKSGGRTFRKNPTCSWESTSPACTTSPCSGLPSGSAACSTRDIQTLRDTPFSEQESVLHEYLSNPRVRRCCIDMSGLGRQFTERAQARYGSARVEGVQFTAAAKEQLAFPLRAAFEDNGVRIPADNDIVADLRSVRKESGISGNVRLVADRDDRGHADRFWALALAYYASTQHSAKFSPVVLSNFTW